VVRPPLAGGETTSPRASEKVIGNTSAIGF